MATSADPVGKILFTSDDLDVVATLDGHLRWRCEATPPEATIEGLFADVLDATFSPRGEACPSSGQPGHRSLHAAAEWLDGEVIFERQPPKGRPDAEY